MRLWKAGILMIALSLTMGCSVLMASGSSSYFEDGPQRDLAIAASAGDKDAMDRALRQGADPNRVSHKKIAMTPLHWVTGTHPNLEGLKYLLANGGDPNLGVQHPEFSDSKIFLMDLAYDNYPESTEYLRALLEAGADPNMPLNNHGETLLFKPLSDTYLEHIKLLIEYGADVNYRNTEYNSTALRRMLTSRSHAAATVMIEAGADPTLEDKFGKSLMSALDTIKEIQITKENDIIARYSSADFWKLIDALRDKGYIDPNDPFWQR